MTTKKLRKHLLRLDVSHIYVFVSFLELYVRVSRSEALGLTEHNPKRTWKATVHECEVYIDG